MAAGEAVVEEHDVDGPAVAGAESASMVMGGGRRMPSR
jgi:hypothetical protein